MLEWIIEDIENVCIIHIDGEWKIMVVCGVVVVNKCIIQVKLIWAVWVYR